MKRETPNRLWYLVLFLAFLAEARLEHFDFCDTAPVVPDAKDEIDHEGIWTNSDVAEQRYIQGWNACCATVIKETE